jgi:hypothetical protein
MTNVERKEKKLTPKTSFRRQSVERAQALPLWPCFASRFLSFYVLFPSCLCCRCLDLDVFYTLSD